MAGPKQDDEKTRPGGERLDEALGFIPLDEAGEEPTSVRNPAARPMAGAPSPPAWIGRSKTPPPVPIDLRRTTERGVLPLMRSPPMQPSIARTERWAPPSGAREPTLADPLPVEPPPLPRPTPAPPDSEPIAPPVASTTDPRVLVDSGLFRSAEAPARASQTEPTDPERAAVTALSPRRVTAADEGQVHVRSPLLRRRTVQGAASRAAQRSPASSALIRADVRMPTPRSEARRPGGAGLPAGVEPHAVKPLPKPPPSRPEARPTIRPGRDPKVLGNMSTSLAGPPPKPPPPPPLPSARSLAPPGQREPTDSNAPPAVAMRAPTDTRGVAAPVPPVPPATPAALVAPPASLVAPLAPAQRPLSSLARDLTTPARAPARDGELTTPARSAHRAGDTDAVPRPSTRPPPKRRRLFATLSLVTLALLFEAMALPTTSGPPWELMLRPTEASFIALAGFLLVIVLHFLPLRPRLRAGFATAVGAVLTGVAVLALQADVDRSFASQPALVGLFHESPAIGLALVLALVSVPAGLFLRGLDPRHLGATALIGFGAAIGLAVACGVGSAFGEVPVTLLIDSAGGAPFVGDRVAAIAALPIIVALAGALAFTWPGLGARQAPGLGVLVWALALLPLLVLALFVDSADHWIAVLGPIKLVTLLGAAALYLAAGLAHLFAPAER